MSANLFVGALGVMQYQAQGKIGKYNQSVNERNAKVLEGQADQIEAKAEFDIAQFAKSFKKIEGETTVALAKSFLIALATPIGYFHISFVAITQPSATCPQTIFIPAAKIGLLFTIPVKANLSCSKV